MFDRPFLLFSVEVTALAIEMKEKKKKKKRTGWVILERNVKSTIGCEQQQKKKMWTV
jgi:hypothetical protein